MILDTLIKKYFRNMKKYFKVMQLTPTFEEAISLMFSI